MNDGHCFKFLLVSSLRNISRERERDMCFDVNWTNFEFNHESKKKRMLTKFFITSKKIHSPNKT
jgi:hypothetical protein